ncbi:MAG: N-formylglutamate amidohydrolase [Bacteroidia bacterium]
MQLFQVNKPQSNSVPILINFPHSGFFIPDDIKPNYNPKAIEFIDDTDWFLPKLYSFASQLGITTMRATHSRWVIDLNRNPESKPLYTDGRHITGLCSTTNFLGNSIYKEEMEPNQTEIDRRKKLYFEPYYHQLQLELDELKAKHGKVLLYDSHSIRSLVKTIREDRFPDIILGTADGQSAHQNLIQESLKSLKQTPYQINHNDPFKGGNITRTFGRPNENQHALQLERCKDLYMKNNETELDIGKAEEMTKHLKSLFENLIEQLNEI